MNKTTIVIIKRIKTLFKNFPIKFNKHKKSKIMFSSNYRLIKFLKFKNNNNKFHPFSKQSNQNKKTKPKRKKNKNNKTFKHKIKIKTFNI